MKNARRITRNQNQSATNRPGRHFPPLPIAYAVATALLAGATPLWAGPTGEQVVAGQATVSRSGTHTLITQGTDRAAINWQSFNIGANESVRFAQPSASSIALNRVLGQNPTEILGSLSANGQVFILNPNGVLFGKGAQVDVGGLVASTLSLSNENFMAGRYNFINEGATGGVVNAGNIIANGGYVALIGPQVRNEGTITAANGSVALAAGNEVTLNLNGNKLIGLAVDQGALNALVENKGAIHANGGQVLLTAKAADQLIKSVVNNDGIIEAGTLSNVNGVIRLEADNVNLGANSVLAANGTRGGDITVQARNGTLLADGRIEAVGTETTGGNIQLLGHQVGLINSASVDASGNTGGGTVLVGGDFQGNNANIQNAFRTYVGPDATIKADAITNGDGGKVIVWADDVTRFFGSASARGGAQGGNGGLIEVSGHESLIFRGNVDAGAPNGAAGRVLFDPKNINIVAGGANPVATNDQFAENAAGTSNIDEALIEVIIVAGTNVTLQANNDITVNQPITLAASAGTDGTLTLQAGRSVLINQSITGTDGAFVAIANSTVANGVIDANRDPGAAAITMANGVTVNTGSGNITLEMRTGPTTNNTSGNITVSNLTTTGNALILQGGQTAGNSILRTAASLITAASVALDVSNAANTTGTVGAAGAGNAVNTTVANLEARTQGGSVFINETNAVVIGGAALGGLTGINSGTGNLTLTTAGAITQTEAITVGGTSSITAGAGVITLTNAANNFTGAVSAANTGANAIQITDANAIQLGTINTANNLTVTGVGITQNAGGLTVGGTSTFNGGAGVITLTTATNNFTGAVGLNNSGANNVSITDANAIVLGTSSVGTGTLTVNATGAVTQTGAITQAAAAGAATFNAGANAITLTNAANNFTGAVSLNNSGPNNVSIRDANAIVLGTSSVGTGTFTVNATGANSITQTGAITQGAGAGAASFTTGGGVITLTQANDFTGPVSATNTGANAIQITDSNAIQLGTINTANNLTVTGVGITQNAGGLTVGGASTFNGGAGVITLTTATNNFTGAVSLNNSGANNVAVTDVNAIVLGTSNVGTGTLTVNATGTVTQTGAITQAAGAGTASFSTGGGVITLTNAGNNFTGAVSAANTGANAIQITDANAIQLGTINTANNLTVTGVGITQNAGGLTVGGTSTFNGGAGVITLTTATNNFTGAVSLNNSGANNVSITDANAIVLGTSSVGTGTLTVNATGAVTQTGAITQAAAAGAATFNAGANAITLTNAANNFTGAVSLNNSGANNASVTDVNAIVLGASSIGQNLVVISGGAMTQSGALTVAGTTTLTAGAANNITLGSANNFVGAVSVVSGNNVTLNDINAIDLGASTISGGLTITAAGAITDSGNLNVTGASSLTAGAANNITLNNANNFTGAVSVVSGNNVALVDTNAIQLGASTVSGTLAVTAGGTISQTGALTVTGATTLTATAAATDILLNTQANNFIGAVGFGGTLTNVRDFGLRNTNAGATVGALAGLTNLRNLTLQFDNAAIALPAFTASGNASITAGGAITDTGNISVTGTTTLTAGAANNITLDNANNFTGAVSVVSGNNVTLNDTNALVLGPISFNGNLAVSNAAGNLTQTGAIVQTGGGTVGFTNLGAGASTLLTNAGNNFLGDVSVTTSGAATLQITDLNAIQFGTIASAGTITVNAVGITQNGAGSVSGGAATFNGGTGDVILANATNNFTGAVRVNTTGNASIRDANAIDLGTSTVGGNYTVTAGLGVTDSGAISANLLTVNAANNITLDFGHTVNAFNASSTAGGVLLNDAGGLNVTGISATGNVTLQNNGTVTQSGAISAAGLELLGAGGTYTLNTQNNAITTLAGNTGTVAFRDDSGFAIGTVNTAGLTATVAATLTSTGTVTQTQAITTPTLTLTGLAGTFTLNGANNAVTTLDADNTALTALAFQDNTGFAVAGINTTGNTTLSSTGVVTQTGVITAAGLELLGVGGNYTLTNTGNNVATLAANTGSVSYVDVDALSVGTVNASLGIAATGLVDVRTQTGNLTLNNAISTSNATANAVTLVADVAAIPNATGTGGNFINNAGAGAITTGAGGAWRIYSGNPSGTTRGGLVEAGKRYNTDDGADPIGAGNRIYFRNQPTLTITADNKTMTYGDATPALTFATSGLIDGDTAGAALSVGPGFTIDGTLSGSGNFTALTPHNIIPAGAAANLGYTIGYTNGALTVNQRALTVSATGVNKTYDGNATATVNLSDNRIALDVFTDTYTSAAFVDRNFGVGKTVNVSGISIAGADAGNYTFNNTAVTTANINKLDVTLTAPSVSKGYDGTLTYTTTLADLTAMGAVLVGGDTLSGATIAYSNRNVGIGNKTVTLSGSVISDGNGGNNYNILAQNGNNTSTITAAPLTVTAQTDNRVYNGNASSAVAPVVTGTLFDAVGTAAAQSFDTRHVGTNKVLTASGLVVNDGNGGNNYLINYVTNNTGVITAAPLTVTAQTDNRVYNGNTSSAVAPVVGALFGTDAIGTAPAQIYDNKNVGTNKVLTASGLVVNDGNGGNNYAISYVTDNTGVITPATITGVTGITANNKVYDATTAATLNTGAAGFTGMIGGDTLTVATAAGAFADANAGVGKMVNVSGITLGGGDAGNYTLASSTATATANITARDISLAANNASKVYGNADPTLTFNVGGLGLAGADTITSVFTGALARAAGENVVGGPYAVNQGTLASNANYNVTVFTPGQLSITPRPLTIGADNKSIFIGQPLPPFTATYSGFAFTDSPASLAGALVFSTSATATSPAGTYVITPSGQSSPNYTITYLSGALTVGQGGNLISADLLASINSGNDQLPPSRVSGQPSLTTPMEGVQPNNVTGNPTTFPPNGAASTVVTIINGGVNLPVGVQ